MDDELITRISRGMERVASLPDIMPQDASERVKPIYQDIQRTLRVPVVNLIFRTLANYPDYLEAAWKQVHTVAQRRDFERAADRLRGEALLDIGANTLELPPHNVEQLRSFNDTIHYVLPKLLLVVALLDTAGGGINERNHPSRDIREGTDQLIPLGIAEGTGKVQMVSPGNTEEHVASLLESIRRAHGHSVTSSYYRGLANWPDYLRDLWQQLVDLVGSPEYEDRRDFLVRRAQEEVGAFPLPDLSATTIPPEISDVLSAFLCKFIPEMMLDVAVAKALADGPEAARHSRFSA
ncbi:hypothetical protein F6455_02405 [Proteobacteria bacterium 005FR1]|nr:hypothetical protein [Proteobacteria bacterium 005FR1]